MRPGRLDSVISVRAPGPETVQRLIRHYAGRAGEGESLEGAGEELKADSGIDPECAERAKLAMIGRGGLSLKGQRSGRDCTRHEGPSALLNRKKDEPSDARSSRTVCRKVLGNVDGQRQSPQSGHHPGMDSTMGTTLSHAKAIYATVRN